MHQHQHQTPAGPAHRLPGPVSASSGMPVAETVVFVAVVPLLGAPVLLATHGATWALSAVAVLAAAVAWLCLARRVVVGADWVADRRVWGYRVTRVSALRAVTFVENGHGGLLKLHPHTGRPHRLRRPEFAAPLTRTALSSLLVAGSATVGSGVSAALALPRHAPAT